MANQGPWGGGGDNNRPEGGNNGRPPRRPGNDGPQIPEIDEIVKKGQEQLRVLMGGRGRTGGGGGGGGGPVGPVVTRQGFALAALAALGLWAFSSFYTVQQDQRSVELFMGKFSAVGEPGLNFAPWPLVTAEIVATTAQRTTDIGSGNDAAGQSGITQSGFMLTRDQNIVDIGFQVVWNVSDPTQYLFNLADPEDTIRAVAESHMRDIIARANLAPILNRDRGAIAAELTQAIQTTLDSYNSGIDVIRVNFNRADPPREVIDSFREVQAAQQQRDRLEKEADAYANQVTAGARGEAARILEDSEAYRARVVNDAQGEASRFISVYEEYVKAPDVTRRRMYLETMENVLGGMNKVILDGVTGEGQGVLPMLPLNGLASPVQQGAAAAATQGGN